MKRRNRFLVEKPICCWPYITATLKAAPPPLFAMRKNLVIK